MDQSTINNLFEGINLEEVKIPNKRTDIHKSECMFSHDTTKSKGGLFICLNTFLCASKMYVNKLAKKTGKKVYLNIVEIPKTKEEESEKNETLVEFGKEKVKIFTEDNQEYDKLLSIVLIKNGTDSNTIIPLPNKNIPKVVQESVDAVLKGDSVQKKQSIVKVQQNLKESIFSNKLIQLENPPIISNNPKDWKCADCDITEDLWLNLSTGKIGCGRKNPDGSGGNGHALDYFEKTGYKYPLVLKLGTATPEGGDVFSYSEGNMVIDTKLKEHLQHFGLDLSKMVKTAKTMDEKSLELSMNYELASSILEKGKLKKPVFGPGLTGLRNIGNQCYMNSLVQVLFSIPEFSKKYFDLNYTDYFSDSNKELDPTKSLDFQLTKLANGLLSGVYSIPSKSRKKVLEKQKEQLAEKSGKKDKDEPITVGQDGIPPASFKAVIGKGHPEFSKFGQQDPSEFFQHLFTRIERANYQKNGSLEGFNGFKFKIDRNMEIKGTNDSKRTSWIDNTFSLNCVAGVELFAENLKEYMEYKKIRKLEEAEEDKLLKEKKIEEEKKALEKFAKMKEAADLRKMGIEPKETVVEEKKEKMIKKEKKKEKTKPVLPVISMKNLIKSYSLPEEIANYKHKGNMTTAQTTLRFRNFPDYLLVKCEKYYFTDNWTPKKLNMLIKDPQEINISELRSQFTSDAKKEEEKVEKKKSYNMEIVSALIGMGINDNQSKRAAIATNNAGVEQAIAWAFDHSQDPNITAPLEEDKGKNTNTELPDRKKINDLLNMGIPEQYAIFSLQKTGSNMERAVDFYFNNMSNIETLMKEEKDEKKMKTKKKEEKLTDGEGKYELFGQISHIGNNVHSGHYVAHIKKNGKWYFFNDESVVESQETPFDKGFLYFYKRK